jgi:hypothetical protein
MGRLHQQLVASLVELSAHLQLEENNSGWKIMTWTLLDNRPIIAHIPYTTES